jgi:hypothetical protein
MTRGRIYKAKLQRRKKSLGKGALPSKRWKGLSPSQNKPLKPKEKDDRA